MKILHICSLDKFIPPFVKYIDENFNSSEHVYWIFGQGEYHGLEFHDNVNFLGAKKIGKFKNTLLLIKDVHTYDKVIFHSFLGTNLAMLFFFLPWVLRKCYWFIWGGDLYSYKARRSLRWYFREFFRRPVIKNMGHLVTYVKGDYELAKEWYGCTGRFIECLMYTSNVYKHVNLDKKYKEETIILLGNSADPENNHIDALKKIEKFKNRNIKIYAPLSYGSKEYADKVVLEGERIFREKFIAITEFMPFQEYLKLLARVDIAIFNHDRQQAMGNTISLLGLGKTVFIKNSTTQWQLFKEKEIEVLDVQDFSLSLISDDAKENNVKKVKEYFSCINLAKQLKIVFKKSN